MAIPLKMNGGMPAPYAAGIPFVRLVVSHYDDSQIWVMSYCSLKGM
jgi:hypothetical protein